MPATVNTTAGKSRTRPLAALLLAGGAVAILYTALNHLIGLRGVPYNLREMFPTEYRPVYVAVFSALLVWLGFAPTLIGDFLVRRPRWLPLLPVWSVLVGLVSWFMLRFSVTVESLKDILGSPTLNWGGDWELLCRFLALQATGTLALLVMAVGAGGVCRLGRRRGLKRGAAALLCALPWLVLAWIVVREWAGTDNLTELLRAGPGHVAGPIALTALAFLLAANAVVLCCVLAGRGVLRKLAAVVATPLMVVPGWALLYAGLNPAVEKYGLTFPAIRFLLGSDRGTAASWWELFFRWGAVQLSAVAVLACGGLIAMLLRPRPGPSCPAGDPDRRADRRAPELGAPARPRRPGRAYLIVTLVYAAFLIYGCLVPFRIQPMPLGSAWRTFTDLARPDRARWSQSDMVTNIAMFVPLTFCALGAWSRENTRRSWWFIAPAIFAAGAAFSVGLEFVQVFVPHRVVSIHDVISQTIGNAIGLGAWVVFGTVFTRWVRGLFGERHRPTLCVKLLYTYAALFVLYQLLPLNLSISATQVMHKYRQGMVNLIPFGDRSAPDPYALMMKTAICVPIGYLLAIRASRSGRPLLWAAFGGFVFSGVLELCQVFVRSRIATTTDVVLGAIGASLGGWLACRAGPFARGPGVHGRWWKRFGVWVKLAVVASWICAMVWKRWQPFDFHWPAAGLGPRIAAVLHTPLFDMVRRLGPLEGAARLGREFGSLLVMGMLIQSLLAPAGGRRRRVVALALTIAAALGPEFGRFFFTGHAPDTTVALSALLGCAASVWTYPRFVRIFLKRPDTEQHRSARA